MSSLPVAVEKGWSHVSPWPGDRTISLNRTVFGSKTDGGSPVSIDAWKLVDIDGRMP